MKRSNIQYMLLLASTLVLGTIQLNSCDNALANLANQLVQNEVELALLKHKNAERPGHHCQSGCRNREELKVVLADYGVQNYQIISVCCCLCLVIGQRQTIESDDVNLGIRRLWHVNRCGALEELANVVGTIEITEYKVWDLCFFKALFFPTEGEQSVLAWQFLRHCGSLRPVEMPDDFDAQDCSFEPFSEGGLHLCTIKLAGTRHSDTTLPMKVKVNLEKCYATALRARNPWVHDYSLRKELLFAEERNGGDIDGLQLRALREPRPYNYRRKLQQNLSRDRLQVELAQNELERHQARPDFEYEFMHPLHVGWYGEDTTTFMCCRLPYWKRLDHPVYEEQFRDIRWKQGPERREALKLSTKAHKAVFAVQSDKLWVPGTGIFTSPICTLHAIDEDPADFTITEIATQYSKKSVVLSERCECGERFLVADMVVTIGETDKHIRVVYRLCGENLVEIFPKG